MQRATPRITGEGGAVVACYAEEIFRCPVRLHANLQIISRPTRRERAGQASAVAASLAVWLAQRRLRPAAVAELLEVSRGLRGAHGYRRIEVRFDKSSLVDFGHVRGPATALLNSFF